MSEIKLERICQVCKKIIKMSSFYDKLRKSYECNDCYLSNKSLIKTKE